MKVTFKKDEKEVRLMAVFLDECRRIGRQFTVWEKDYEWEVSINY